MLQPGALGLAHSSNTKSTWLLQGLGWGHALFPKLEQGWCLSAHSKGKGEGWREQRLGSGGKQGPEAVGAEMAGEQAQARVKLFDFPIAPASPLSAPLQY